MKAREVKRAKLVAKYAAKRAALKEIVNHSDDPRLLSKPHRSFSPSPATPIPSVCTTVARSRDVPRATSASSASRVSSSVRWLRPVSFPVCAKHLGKRTILVESQASLLTLSGISR